MKRFETSLSDQRATVPLAEPDPSEARTVLGRYRLEQRLGAGGFGVVWQAWDEKLERRVAVKAIPRERGGGERVEREARAAARLNHPGIVGIYELASDDQEIYLVSELVRGRTMAELEREGALSDRDVARIGTALCDALEHAHARGVIHRDVKPQNVMVARRAGGGSGLREARGLRRGPRGERRPAHPHRRPGRHPGLHVARAGGGRPRVAARATSTRWR